MNNILEVKNLTKQFGNFTAVNNISFSVKEGEILGFLGPNGAGKTTTIYMLLDVMEPSSGEIKYFGKSFKKERSEILKRINYSSAYISLPWLFTLDEVLNVYADLYEIQDKKKRITKLLQEFEIEHLRKKAVSTLSAGEKARLLLTKAFLNYPEIILLDEPTASLDPDIAVKIRAFLKKEQKEYGVSMVFTSHNMSEVEEMCDRTIILNQGKIIAEDTPENLANEIKESEVELWIKDIKKAKEMFDKENVKYRNDKNLFFVSIETKRISEFLVNLTNKNISFEDITINKPNLEDYFLKVSKNENL